MSEPLQSAPRNDGGDTSAGVARLSTGNPQADHILCGGFPLNSINIVMGQPGTGKTIFAEQLVFHNADDGRPILYFSTLSEPLAKMVTYLQHFQFFDESKLGTAVVYDDIGSDLTAGGISGLVPRLKQAITTFSPKIIAIDSFKAMHDLAESASATRRMMHEMAGLLTAYDTTVFLIGEYHEDDIARFPEFAIADGIVEFSRRKTGTRDERFIRVFKLRGSNYLEGAHAFAIGEAGLEIFPRLVSPATPAEYDSVAVRISTGIPGLDPMMGGGPWRGSSTLIAGPSGSGKTTIGLQFAAEGVRVGEPSLYYHFQENPTQLARTIQGLGLDLTRLQADGLHLAYCSPVELRLDRVIVDLFRRIEAHGIKRVVIDSLGDLALSANDPRRFHDYLYALTQHFVASGVTSVMTIELSQFPASGVDAYVGSLGSVMDNVLLLQLSGGNRTQRTLRVIKTRGSRLDPQVRELEITSDGGRIV